MARGRTLLVLSLLTSGCAQEVVAHLVPENEANEIKLLLETEAGIEAEKMKDEESRDLRFNLHVPKADAQRAYSVMKKHNLPKVVKDTTGSIFKEGGLIPTNTQERAKREVGIKGDIEEGLRRIPGIVDVYAHVSIPEDNPLRDVNEAKPRPKIGVVIIFIPDAEKKPPIDPTQVQQHVQAAVPEIKTAEVSVQMIPVSMGRAPAAAGADGVDVGAQLVNGCEKVRVLGIDVCQEHQRKLLNFLIVSAVTAAVLAALAVISVLRALRYRKDLTRLTAQVAQLKK